MVFEQQPKQALVLGDLGSGKTCQIMFPWALKELQTDANIIVFDECNELRRFYLADYLNDHSIHTIHLLKYDENECDSALQSLLTLPQTAIFTTGRDGSRIIAYLYDKLNQQPSIPKTHFFLDGVGSLMDSETLRCIKNSANHSNIYTTVSTSELFNLDKGTGAIKNGFSAVSTFIILYFPQFPFNELKACGLSQKQISDVEEQIRQIGLSWSPRGDKAIILQRNPSEPNANLVVQFAELAYQHNKRLDDLNVILRNCIKRKK